MKAFVVLLLCFALFASTYARGWYIKQFHLIVKLVFRFYCLILFLLSFFCIVITDNTKEEPQEDNEKAAGSTEAVGDGEKDPKDSEKFLFGPMLNVLGALTGIKGPGGFGGLGGLGGHHHGHHGHGHGHYPPHFGGYPPYGHYGPYGGYGGYY